MSQPPQSSPSYPNPNKILIPDPNPITQPPLDPYSSSATYGSIYQPQPPVVPCFASATNGGFQPQALNQFPQPNHTTFPTALDSLIGTGLGSVMCPPYGNYNMDTQYLNKDVMDTAMLSNTAPTFQCDVCHIVCNGKDVFDNHTQGKKHQKNLQIQARSIHNVAVGSSSANVTGELEMKKQTLLQNGAPVSSLFPCTICNIVCGDEAAFQKHLIGKKHAKQVAKQTSNAAPASTHCDLCQINCNCLELFKKHLAGKRHLKNLEKSEKTVTENPEDIKGEGESLHCDLCQISCNSLELFKTHLAGKRHLKNLEKSEKNITENPEDIKGEGENLHCDLCQISCNSLELFKTHLAGKRHLKNLEKSEKSVTENPDDIKGEGESLQETKSMTDINIKGENLQETEKKTEVPVTLENDLKNKNPQNTQSTGCEVCNITCTSLQLLNAHLEGKKHKKNVLKAEAESFVGPLVGPVSQIIGPTWNPNGVEGGSVAEKQTPAKRSRGSNEDLETKKQKIVRGGGAPDLVRVCNICNVACSSPTVYISHLAGRKHLAVAKKATEAGIPSVTV